MKRISKVALAILLFIISFLSAAPALAQVQYGYKISSYDVDVKIRKDGSLDITEKVKYTHMGNSNNAVLLIDRQENEEIEILNVYTIKKSEYIKCERLSAGQWDANVFTGTYSEVQEGDRVRIKIYGSFTNQQATFIVQYRVKNAIKKYNDIAEYKRNHVFKNWGGYISNIEINVALPGFTSYDNIKPYLHGVLVGSKNVSDMKNVSYSIPNTVPGEYVEVRIAFPPLLVPDAAITEDTDYLETFIQEEKEYSESDKSDLLKARENAAREAGRLAWNEKIKKRTMLFFAAVSLFASYLGVLTIFRTARELRKDKEAFELKDIAGLSPSEAGFLIKGRAGARAFIAGLFHLAYKGMLDIDIRNDDGKDLLCFTISGDTCAGKVSVTEKYLLDCVKEFSEKYGSFCPGKFSAGKGVPDQARLAEYYKAWSETLKNDFNSKSVLNTDQLYYRNLGLIMGVVLFAAGCIVPVAMSIWSGYLMLPVGFLLSWYSLNIRKMTQYRLARVRALKKLRRLMTEKDFSTEDLPDELSDPLLLLSYSIVLYADNKLLKSGSISETEGPQYDFIDERFHDKARNLISRALAAIDNTLVSNLE